MMAQSGNNPNQQLQMPYSYWDGDQRYWPRRNGEEEKPVPEGLRPNMDSVWQHNPPQYLNISPASLQPYQIDHTQSSSIIGFPGHNFRSENGYYCPNPNATPLINYQYGDFSLQSQWRMQQQHQQQHQQHIMMASTSQAEPKTNRPQASTPPHRTGPGTNNVRVRTNEKYRTVYSDHQRMELEKEFSVNQFVTAERKAQLSTELKLTERQVKIWFQNRRAKNRQENKKAKRR